MTIIEVVRWLTRAKGANENAKKKKKDDSISLRIQTFSFSSIHFIYYQPVPPLLHFTATLPKATLLPRSPSQFFIILAPLFPSFNRVD